MDDDDGLLIPAEEKCEKEAVREKIEQWKANEANQRAADEAYHLSEMNVNRFSLERRSVISKFVCLIVV